VVIGTEVLNTRLHIGLNLGMFRTVDLPVPVVLRIGPWGAACCRDFR